MKNILEVSYQQCRWPVAEDRSGQHLFCARRTEVGSSYCPDHHAMSVDPDPPEWWLELDDLFGVKH